MRGVAGTALGVGMSALQPISGSRVRESVRVHSHQGEIQAQVFFVAGPAVGFWKASVEAGLVLDPSPQRFVALQTSAFIYAPGP